MTGPIKPARRIRNQFGWLVSVALLVDIVAHVVLFIYLAGNWQNSFANVPQFERALAIAILVGATLVMGLVIKWVTEWTLGSHVKGLERELSHLRVANNRAKSLQAMASTLRATLSFERVVEAALDVCSLALEEIGVPARAIVGAVFLFDGEELQPIAHRNFSEKDTFKRLMGQFGVAARAMERAEPLISKSPGKDPELRELETLANCYLAVCVPLRAGFQIFGTIVLGSQVPVSLGDDHLELFNSVADQAVIALQNAQLYQALEADKDRIIEAEEEARKKLARDLHDGPTQSVAIIAMRVNFILSLMQRDPQKAQEELKKVEELAKQTSQEIRGMLFTLRPLVLETQGLGAAIEMAMKRANENENSIKLRLIGGETGDLLSERAQGVVFYVIEEAMGNARKHANANQIDVHMWREDDLFVARVSDNGNGFDTRDVIGDYSARGSLGMVNMRERADLIDGSLKIESAPGRGTSVTLVVPLAKHGRDVSRDNGHGG